MCELRDCVLAHVPKWYCSVSATYRAFVPSDPGSLSFPFPFAAHSAEPNSTFACIIFNYKCAHFVDDTTQARVASTSMGTIRVVAIYFDPEHLILLKLSIRLGFGAKFYRRPCHHIDGANGIDENSNTATPSTIYREIETSIGGVYWWRICVAGETASSVNWQTTINSISILESANWPIKIFTIRRVRRMENRNFIFRSGTKREWRQPVDGRWHLTRLHAAPHVFFFSFFFTTWISSTTAKRLLFSFRQKKQKKHREFHCSKSEAAAVAMVPAATYRCSLLQLINSIVGQVNTQKEIIKEEKEKKRRCACVSAVCEGRHSFLLRQTA